MRSNACAVVERYVEREGDDGVVRAMFGRVAIFFSHYLFGVGINIRSAEET